MMKQVSFLILAGIVGFSAGANASLCTDMTNKTQSTQLTSAVRQKLSSAADSFALKLLNLFHGKKAEENSFMSANGLTSAFSTVLLGADAASQRKILDAIDFKDVTVEDVIANEKLSRESLKNELGFRLLSKTAFFSDTELDPVFKRRLIEDLEAKTDTMNFQDAENSARIINEWVKKETNNLIDKLVSAEEIAQLAWLGLNSKVLDAEWAGGKFDSPDQGSEVQFYSDKGQPLVKDGKSVKVGLMTSNPKMPIVEVKYDNYSVYQIPYKLDANGKPMGTFNLVLPKLKNEAEVQESFWSQNKVAPQFDSLSKVLAQLTPEALQKIDRDIEAKVAQKRVGWLLLKVPKFKVEFEADHNTLKSAITDWGAGSIFGSIDLSGMVVSSAKALWARSKIALIKQKAVIEFSETGTKAAAVSAIGGFPESCPPPEVTVDRPFVYFIKDAQNRIIFAGTFVDPTTAKLEGSN